MSDFAYLYFPGELNAVNPLACIYMHGDIQAFPKVISGTVPYSHFFSICSHGAFMLYPTRLVHQLHWLGPNMVADRARCFKR